MHPYYDSNQHEPGMLGIANELPDGGNVKALTESLGMVAGSITPGTSLIILERPRYHNRFSMYVKVLAPGLGDVWIRACDVTIQGEKHE